MRKKRLKKRKNKVNHYFHPECLKKQCTVKMAWESFFFFFFCNCNCSLHDPLLCVPMVVELEMDLAMLARAQRTMRLNDTVDIISEDLFIVINQCCMPIVTPEASANGIQTASEFRNWVVTFSFFW